MFVFVVYLCVVSDGRKLDLILAYISSLTTFSLHLFIIQPIIITGRLHLYQTTYGYLVACKVFQMIYLNCLFHDTIVHYQRLLLFSRTLSLSLFIFIILLFSLQTKFFFSRYFTSCFFPMSFFVSIQFFVVSGLNIPSNRSLFILRSK